MARPKRLSVKTYLSFLIVQILFLCVVVGGLFGEAKRALGFLLDHFLVVLLDGLLGLLFGTLLSVLLTFGLQVVLLVLLSAFLLINFL